MKRRIFLKGTLAASATGMAANAGLLASRAAAATEAAAATGATAAEAVTAEAATVAADTVSTAFSATTLEDTLKALDVTPEESDQVSLDAPDIAENGVVVPVTVKTRAENVSEIAIVVADNPTPLAAIFTFPEGGATMASTRLKMGKTSNVLALVKSGDKVLMAKKEVKVTIGGCGG
ncbi:MAG: thiosulfate oxidation carrier protein SoxY [Thiothrix sp.]|nr:thiosulfate oxidation carrier protein SoxY [Thiothrix sp.]HPE60084.1 thiosulfate oxidation carrier protein SoxY [Thiolinea sp.]